MDCPNKINVILSEDIFNLEFPVVSGSYVSAEKKMQFSKQQIKSIFEPLFSVNLLRCVERNSNSESCNHYTEIEH
jgi:hypothetical protein